MARFLIEIGKPAEALALGQSAIAADERVFGSKHPQTAGSVRVTADALDALGRAEEAKALREQYGLAQLEKPSAS